jgi:flagellar hook-basal body complex protein FliE
MDGITSVGGASRAYQSASKIAQEPISTTSITPKRSFSELIEQSARNAVETVREGDRAAIAGLRGEISTQEVVEATMEMQSTLQVTIAVRDKVLEAYQEIMRMAV